MSLFKSIGRIFKKVLRVAKKVLPIALAVGAVVFTAGAALGLPALAGGWGGAVASGLGSLGISTTGALGSVLTGAITQAGFGAAIGGGLTALTGGSFSKGAGVGALTGAVTGGLTGAYNYATAPGASVSTRSPTGLGEAAKPVATNAATAPANAATQAVTGTADAATQAVTGGVAQAAKPTGLLGTLNNVASSPLMQSPMIGMTVAGLGQGLMSGLGAKEEAKERRQNQQRITESYDVDPSAYDYAQPDTTTRPSPEARWGRPDTTPRRARYRYNRDTQSIENVG